jgi:hypothetical protein
MPEPELKLEQAGKALPMEKSSDTEHSTLAALWFLRPRE